MNRSTWNRRHFTAALGGVSALGALGGAGSALAQPAFVEGRHYLRYSPALPTSVPAGKIEVLEFFSYACPHCHAFEPVMHAWVQKLPADVVFRRVPVPFLFNAENFQRLYYSLEVLGQVDAVQPKVFDAYHVQKKMLNRPEAIGDFAAHVGLDKQKFMEAFGSFSVVQVKVPQANKLVERYNLRGVPALAIGGRYLTSPSQAGGDAVPERMGQQLALQLTDELIARVRKGG